MPTPLSGLRYVLGELRENADDAYWRQYRVSERIIRPLHERILGDDDGEYVRQQDWDTLIILDACRADLFEEFVDLDQFDEYRRAVSLASKTDEWTMKNWLNAGTDRPGEHGDTVYTTANPVTSKVAPDSFHHLAEPWAEDEAFDEELHAVPPEPITAAARRNVDDFPNKRHVIHYVQPHMPLIADPEMIYRTWWRPGSGSSDAEASEGPKHIWSALANGVETRTDVWEAYGDTLQLVFEEAVELARDLPGRTVIASDHGNMLGERPPMWPVPIPIQMYGHPGGLRCPELVQVPWAVIEAESPDDRPEIVDDGVASESTVDSALIEERLADLGYV